MSRALFLGIKGNKGWLLSGSSALPGKEQCQTRTRPGPGPLPGAPTACDKRGASGLCRIFREMSTFIMFTRFSEVVVSFLETKEGFFFLSFFFFFFPFFGNNSWE